jgi:hypothetical protein
MSRALIPLSPADSRVLSVRLARILALALRSPRPVADERRLVSSSSNGGATASAWVGRKVGKSGLFCLTGWRAVRKFRILKGFEKGGFLALTDCSAVGRLAVYLFPETQGGLLIWQERCTCTGRWSSSSLR